MRAPKAVGVVCVLAFAVTACSQGNGSTGGQQNVNYAKGGTFTEPITTDPGNLNPLAAVQGSTNEVDSFAYDTLINIDPNSGKVIPQLATSWQVSPASVTFTLRKDVTCADGATLTPSGVAATFAFIKDPKNQSTMIGNGLPSPDFTVKSDDVAGTVTLTLSSPFGFLLQGAGLIPIVCPKGLAKPSAIAHKTDGTGPFNLTEYVPDDHLTFAVRKDYRWGPNGASTAAAGVPAKVVFRVVQSESTEANLMLSGQLSDAAIGGPDRLRLQGRGFQSTTRFSGPDELFYNQRAGHPTADLAVRKALTMAVDIAQLAKVASQGTGEPPSSLTVNEPRQCGDATVPGSLPGHDLAAAKAALDTAGWTVGAGGVRAKGGHPLTLVVMYSSAGPGIDAGMELLSQWWTQLGVKVTLKVLDPNASTQALFQGSVWDASFLGVGISNPSQFLPVASGPLPPQGQNFAAVANPEYQRISAQALATPGQPGCVLWYQAERSLFHHLDVVPVMKIGLVDFFNKTRFAEGVNGPEPTSVRILAG